MGVVKAHLPFLILPLLAPAVGAADLPAGATAKFTPASSTGTTAGNLDLNDTGNRVWTLQSSPDLSKWTDLRTVKPNNSFLRVTLPKVAGTPTLFYRLHYNSDFQSAANGVADALQLPSPLSNYAQPSLPAHLLTQQIRGQDNTPANNATTNAGATLGRVLFYDKRLSANNTISCSSCHQPEHGFSDPRRFSVGFNGGLTGRNSMGLTNNRYYLRGHYFWDERAATLEDQVLLPIQNTTEMGLTLGELVTKVSAEPYYQTLFTSAYGDSSITSNRISRSLAQFVRSIVSGNSKYDAGVPVGFTNFTQQENQGRQIFTGPEGGCSACHGSDNFVPGPNIFNNGLENPYVDKGVGEVSGLAADEGLFKVPSLRNIQLTAPYMHDGRFATLEEVVEFYNSGVVNHPNLSPQLRLPPGPPGSPPPPPRRLNLSPDQKTALVAFLKTLTDTSVTTDPKFSDPFRYDAP